MIVHVAVVKNISSVVANNARKPSIYKGLRVFSSILIFSIQRPFFQFRYLFLDNLRKIMKIMI